MRHGGDKPMKTVQVERCCLQRRQAENLRAVGWENKTGNHY